MSDDKKCCGGNSKGVEKSSSCCGNSGKKSCCKSAILLVILIVVALGVFLYINNKDGVVGSNEGDASKVASSIDESSNNKVDADPNPVIAKINGQEIKRLEVLEFINSMPVHMKQMPIEQLFPMALEQIINNKIIDERAKSSGLEKDEEVIKLFEEAKKQIIRVKFLENAINEKVTQEALKIKYDEYVKNFPDVEEVKAAHILVDDEKTAKEIIKKLNKGADFTDLAKEYSKDGSSESGGSLGYFTKDDVVPSFADAAFAIKVGEYTKKPVKSEFGYHIIKIEDKRKRPPAEFSQIKPYIEQEMQRSVFEELLEEWKKQAEIKRFDINGKPIIEDSGLEDVTADIKDQESSDSQQKEGDDASITEGDSQEK